MNCKYCQTWNADDEHRCRRCGRRRLDAPGGMRYNAAATARAIEAELGAETLRGAAAGPRLIRETAPYQRSLFAGGEAPRSGPVAVAEGRARVAGTREARPRTRKVSDAQQKLEFPPLAEAPLPGKPLAGVIQCDDAVAILPLRAAAALANGAGIALGLAVFAAATYFMGARFVPDKRSWFVLLLAALSITAIYGALWCAAGRDSAGLKLAGLRLVNFDGRRPTARQRWLRLTWGFLSVFAAGMGLFWAFTDEEKLTWHDHVSNTFASPAGRDAG